MANSELKDALEAKTPDSIEELLSGVTPEIYASLKESVALGRWPDGAKATPVQIENAMQLIILYEYHNLPEDQRIGHSLNKTCGSGEASDTQNLKIIGGTKPTNL